MQLLVLIMPISNQNLTSALFNQSKRSFEYNTISNTLYSNVTENVFGSDESASTSGVCNDWKEAQHALFQLANFCMVVSFLTPSNFRHHAFFLRFMLNFGYLFSVFWAGLFICMLDVLLWNLVFFIINTIHVVYLGYKMLPDRFNRTLEELYEKTFKPLRINRNQFRELTAFGNILLIAKGGVYATEGYTKYSKKLSMLLKGRLKVTHEGLYLHSVEANHFVDSLEYDSAKQHNQDDTYQVSITGSEDSLVLSWSYCRLRSYLERDPHMQHVFHNMIGKDVSQKLYQIQEMLSNNPHYMETLAPSRHSSMVNVRQCMATNSSNHASSKLNCFGIDMKGCMIQSEQPSNQSSLGTYETSV